MKYLQKGKNGTGKLHSSQKAAIAIIVVAAVALSVWYHIPLKTHEEIMVFNLKDSENYANVSLDLVIYRSFVFPTEVRGEIRFEDVTYVPWAKEEFSFSHRILKKIKGEVVTPVWINASNIGHIGTSEPSGIGHDRMLSDLIYIQYIEFGLGFSIEKISLMKTSDGSSIWER